MAAGGNAFAIQGDFTKVADVQAAFVAAKKEFGGIDIAINTVGKVLKKPFVETTEEEYDSMCAINSKAAYSSSRKRAGSSMMAAQNLHHRHRAARGLHGPVFDV